MKKITIKLMQIFPAEIYGSQTFIHHHTIQILLIYKEIFFPNTILLKVCF